MVLLSITTAMEGEKDAARGWMINENRRKWKWKSIFFGRLVFGGINPDTGRRKTPRPNWEHNGVDLIEQNSPYRESWHRMEKVRLPLPSSYTAHENSRETAVLVNQ